MDTPEEDANLLTPEYLRNTDTSGLPSAQLKLKIGIPVMLLHNLRLLVGLCNGYRLRIGHLYHCYDIPAEILLGSCTGTIHYIPHITLTPGPGDLYFTSARRQYLIRPRFTMAINKSLDQLHIVGLDLRSSVFSHGQLCVALSRIRNGTDIHVRCRFTRA